MSDVHFALVVTDECAAVVLDNGRQLCRSKGAAGNPGGQLAVPDAVVPWHLRSANGPQVVQELIRHTSHELAVLLGESNNRVTAGEGECTLLWLCGILESFAHEKTDTWRIKRGISIPISCCFRGSADRTGCFR